MSNIRSIIVKNDLSHIYFCIWLIAATIYHAIKSRPIEARPEYDGSQTVKFYYKFNFERI
jgi:hypothetical protein